MASILYRPQCVNPSGSVTAMYKKINTLIGEVWLPASAGPRQAWYRLQRICAEADSTGCAIIILRNYGKCTSDLMFRKK